jgi:dienelactone hydrolase
MVHIHGLMMGGSDHTAVPMQMTSHGYLVVVPDQLDETAPWTTDANDEDVWFNNPLLKDIKNIDQVALKADQEIRYAKRKGDAHAVGLEIKESDFLNKIGLADRTPSFDSDRLFISGQSMGGWTSIISCCGDQDIFKVSLTHDAAFF